MHRTGIQDISRTSVTTKLCLLVLATLSCNAFAQADTVAAVDLGVVDDADRELMTMEAYLDGHPDQHFRRLGVEAREHGRLDKAREYFRRAARYADKLAQGVYAEMLWNGEGGAADRALGYAWMDLAAERGAPMLVAHRERFWSELAPVERERALREGRAVYAEYGDEVAKPRLEGVLRRERRSVTGSRTGALGMVDICFGPIAADGTCMAPKNMDASRFFADKHWRAEQYWRWQDDLLRTPQREEKVEVGDPVALPAPAGSGGN